MKELRIETSIKNLKNYKIYLRVEKAVNEFLLKKGYLKIDLPVLSPVLIPESYLEVFRTEFRYLNRKEKLYLTPSPELFLKRLLTCGLGNCYYIGKAFRNSEPNSNFHSPEFTMLEFYRVGFTYLQLADEILEMMEVIARELNKNKTILYQSKQISFKKWEKYTVVQAFKKFSNISEEELLTETLFIKKARRKGYIVKGFSYQDLFSQIISQEIEPRLGIEGYPTLLYDYPREMSSLAKLKSNKKIAKRAEFYINGIEIGGCCEELFDWKEQEERFRKQIEKRKKLEMIDLEVDKGFIEALKYGLPDCAGAGIGFERLAMIFSDAQSINQLKLIDIK